MIFLNTIDSLRERLLLNTNMERRKSNRQAVDLQIDFYCCEAGCNGTAQNISARGMFIKTRETCFPVNTQFNIYYNSQGKLLQIPVRLRRIVRDDSNSGIGISFINDLKRPVTAKYKTATA